MTRYLLQKLSRAEEETSVRSLPLDEPLNNYGLHALLMTSESDTRITTALEAEYHATIHVRSKLRLFQLFKDRLNEDRRTLFKTTCFGPWLDIIYVENDDGMIHYVLQKQCCSDDDNFDLPLIYHVNGHSLHFGRREFCLLTGFEFGSISFRQYRNGDIPFRNRLFPEKIGYDVKIIDLFALFDDEEKFSKLSDADAIRLCLLLSLEIIFMGRELVSVVDDVYLRMVNDLDAWNSFPWGEIIWRQLYDSIRNVSSKHKLEHLAGLKRNPNLVLSYSLTGFLFCFQDMDNRVFLCIGSLVDQSARNHTESIVMEEKGRIYPAPIELAPTKDEVQCNWYAPSNDYFMWYVPRSPPVSIGGLYGEYMNKRSAARAAKKKSSEDLHPSECVREASLIDRVRDLECICKTLLTLPKEVKSLRGRIHKLESIIQSTFYPSRVVEKQETLKKVVPQIEDYLQSTSEDEQDIKDHTSLKQDDDQRQQDHISNMTEVSKQKIQSKIKRLYNHREARLNKIAEEDKQRKFLGHMNSSAHMKLAIEHCVPKKRKYVDVLRSLFCALPKISNVPSIEQLANQKNVLNPLMIEKCKSVKPWIEDLSRPFKRIDKNFLSHELQVFLSRVVVGRCKFPWCNDITVDRSFWNGLCALDDNRKGWLLDEHIDLWVTYLWLTRQTDMDWAMVSSYFLPLLLQGSMPLFYANNDIYPVPWSNVERMVSKRIFPLALDDPLQSAALHIG
ncbi:phospholipase-like protein [Tanacetum coccineum]|uniref:Phospholipase-like protein n=1 Tax=Tanacetum coccineum TaxID=301880 RepID=A0ABQ5E8Q0_9ASTR